VSSPRFSWLLFAVCCVFVLKLSACKSAIDPNKHHYHCVAAADCGSGFDCIGQADGGSLCFKTGECSDHEECNGKDDNCNGLVDETWPDAGAACSTGKHGQCAAGIDACADGGVVCVQQLFPTTEACDGLDNDCDGVVDNGFDLQTDVENCGSCGHLCVPTADLTCADGKCRELNCSDGIDNDDSGFADCLDPFCAGQKCFTDSDGGLWHCAVAMDGGVSDGGTDGGADGGSDAGDQDGGTDAGTDQDGGTSDGGGLDGGTPDGGGGPIGCYPPETDCSNGIDDDLNGLTDCADPACDGQTCSTGAACTMGNCPPAG
jgi:hypothetical protein